MPTVSRKEYAAKVGYQIAPARVRRFMDRFGVNRENGDRMDRVKTALRKHEKGSKYKDYLRLKKMSSKEKKQLDTEGTATEKENYAAVMDYKTNEYETAKKTYEKNYKPTRDKYLNNEKEIRKLRYKLKGDSDNEELQAEIKKLEAVSASLKRTVDKLASKPIIDKLVEKETISKSRTRFNEDAQVAATAALQFVFSDLVEHAMETAIKNKKKIIQPHHCITDNHEDLIIYPMMRDCQSYLAVMDYEDAVYDYKLQVEKDNREKKKKKNTEIPKREKPELVLESNIPKKGTNDLEFKFYATQIIKTVKARLEKARGEEYTTMRISTNIKQLISNLIVEIIGKINKLLLIVMGLMKVKTITKSAVISVIDILLVSNDDEDKKEELHEFIEAMVEKNRKFKNQLRSGEIADSSSEPEHEEPESEPEPAPKKHKKRSRSRKNK